MSGLPKPGMFVNPLRTIANGGPEVQQIQRFLTTMKGSGWGSNAAVQQFVTQTATQLPGKFTQFLNAVSWTGAAGLTGYGAATAPW